MRYDVIVMGAGLAGMIAMLRFASEGFSVLGLEFQKNQPLDPNDLRSTALLMPSIAALEAAGVWDDVKGFAAPLDVMEIIDAKVEPARSVAFRAQEIKQEHFGYNFFNAKLHGVLREKLLAHPKITLQFEADATAYMPFEDRVALRVNGETVEARLLIGADGRRSKTRQLLGIGADERPIEQVAQVFTVTHELPHENMSTEVHLEGGPFTLVPLNDVDGKPASAVVWMDKPENAQARLAMPQDEFEAALNARSFGVRGLLTLSSAIGAFPMMTLEANHFAKGRGVVIGEAAHVVPPIGAQGLNMSIRDIESLLRIALRGGLEDAKYLTQWARQRKMDITIRKDGIGLLNAISIGDMSRTEQLRRLGLDVLAKESPLRRGLMRMGLGA